MLTLKIISPEKEILNQEVELVELPGLMGRFEVLKNHAPLISPLVKGVISYKNASSRRSIEVESGFAEVRDNVITVCIE